MTATSLCFVERENSIDEKKSAVREFDDGGATSFNHMIVGYDTAVLAHEKAARLAQDVPIFVRHNDRYDGSVRQFCDCRYVFSRRWRLCRKHCSSEKNQIKKFHLDCCKPQFRSLLLLQHNLTRLRGYNLGFLSMARDLPRHAHPRILIFRLGRTELGAIATPD